jgi:hypothetical protein
MVSCFYCNKGQIRGGKGKNCQAENFLHHRRQLTKAERDRMREAQRAGEETAKRIASLSSSSLHEIKIIMRTLYNYDLISFMLMVVFIFV